MYNIIYETSRHSRFNAQYWMLGAGALGRPRGMVWGGRREECSGWGTHVYLWRIHFNIWQNQYNIVKFKNKIKYKKKKRQKKICRGPYLDFFPKKSQTVKRYMKRYSTSLIIWEMKIKTTMRYCFMAIRMAVIKKMR